MEISQLDLPGSAPCTAARTKARVHVPTINARQPGNARRACLPPCLPLPLHFGVCIGRLKPPRSGTTTSCWGAPPQKQHHDTHTARASYQPTQRGSSQAARRAAHARLQQVAGVRAARTLWRRRCPTCSRQNWRHTCPGRRVESARPFSARAPDSREPHGRHAVGEAWHLGSAPKPPSATVCYRRRRRRRRRREFAAEQVGGLIKRRETCDWPHVLTNALRRHTVHWVTTGACAHGYTEQESGGGHTRGAKWWWGEGELTRPCQVCTRVRLRQARSLVSSLLLGRGIGRDLLKNECSEQRMLPHTRPRTINPPLHTGSRGRAPSRTSNMLALCDGSGGLARREEQALLPSAPRHTFHTNQERRQQETVVTECPSKPQKQIGGHVLRAGG